MNKEIATLEVKLRSADLSELERVDLLNRLAWMVWGTDAQRSEQMAKKAIELAQDIGDQRGLAYAKRNLGVVHYLRSEVEEAVNYQMDALQWFEENGEKEGIATVNIALAYLYWGFGDFQRGFDCAYKALNQSQEIQYQEGLAWSYDALGVFYFDSKDLQQSTKYFQQACDLFRQIDDTPGEARALNGLGNACRFSGDYKKALKYQTDSLRIYESISNWLGRSKTLNDIGLIFQGLGEPDEAIKYHRESLQLRQETSYIQGQATSLLDIGDVLAKKGELKEAQEAFLESIALSDQVKAKPKTCRAHAALAQVFKQMGQYDKALQHYEKFQALEEEVFHEDSDKRLKNLQAVYQLEATKKQTEIFRLKNVELKEKNEQLQQTLKKLSAAQAQLLQAGKMAALGKLVAGIAHELNSPVGTVKSAADVYQRGVSRVTRLLSDDSSGDSETKVGLRSTVQLLKENDQAMSSAIDRIERILYSLRKFIRLDEAPLKETNINEDIEGTLSLIRQEIGDEIEVVRDFAELPKIYSHPSELNQVFMNLLLNAAQSIKGRGRINIKTFARDSQVYVQISDNGKGIAPERLAHFFEPGFTERDSQIRMRTGLFTSYNIVHKHQGQIRIDSELGKGTRVTVSLPEKLAMMSSRSV